MSRNRYQLSRVVATVSWLLLNIVRTRRLGEVFTGDVGWLLARDHDTVLGPTWPPCPRVG